MRWLLEGQQLGVTTEDHHPRRLSLRVLLLLIFAAALSPVLVIGGIRWASDIEREASNRREVMTLVAQEAAGRAEYMLDAAPALLSLMGSIAVGDSCNEPIRELIDAMPEFENLVVIDSQGAALCASPGVETDGGYANSPWFQQLQTSSVDLVRSTAFRSAPTGDWTIATALRRETSSGEFDGAFLIGVPISSLVARLSRSRLHADADLGLVDTSGQVFASSHWTQLSAADTGKLNRSRPAFIEVTANEGGVRQMAVVPLAQSDLFMVLSASKPTPIALENVSAFGSFALPLMAWLLALITAWLAMDRLVLRWLDYLRRIAGLYASGKLSVQPLRARRQAPDEIKGLADTMEEMATRIRDRTTRMENALSARDAAMKEIHHRVKNNLQIINSLLSLQGRKLKDPAAIAVLDDARARINALSLIHRSLYEHDNIRAVEARSFFSELAAQLDQALGAEDQGIRIEADIDKDTLDADVAVPLALFTAEAVTTSVKHAFPQGVAAGAKRIRVVYRVTEAEAQLSVEDDGVGAITEQAAAGQGIGATLMNAFAKQVRGVMKDEKSASGGRRICVYIPRIKGVTGAYPTLPPVNPASVAG